MGLTEALARHWCVDIAAKSQCQVIKRDGAPYLRRYFIAGWNPITKRPGPALFLHQFVASDDTHQVHSHPWAWGASLILVGGYREHRCGESGTPETREFHPGDVNLIAAADRHRIELLSRDCWTLFLAGNVSQSWDFQESCV